MISGTIYGVLLNDADEHRRLADAFGAKPYEKPPEAPIVYIKPANCVSVRGAPVLAPDDAAELETAATLGLLIGRDTSRVAAVRAWNAVAAACLALDVSLPAASHYRPTVTQRSRDGFLPLGDLAAPIIPRTITTLIDGAEAHAWPLDRLVRSVAALIADLSAFMTLRAGDLLLIGLPGDAPRARPGQKIEVSADGLPMLTTFIERAAR